MPYGFLDIAITPSVKAVQEANGTASLWSDFKGHRQFDRLTDPEKAFIAERDSFYMATVSETGWPYVQHRGGPKGFLRVLDDKTLAFADFRGNLQYLSVGNLAADNRVSLILMDYAARRRLKIFARSDVKSLKDSPELAEAVASPGFRAFAERVMLLHLEAFDWNCPQFITPRFTEAEIGEALAPVHQRLKQLETENQMLRETLAATKSGEAAGS